MITTPHVMLLLSAPLHALWNLGVKRTPSKTAASALVAALSVVFLAIESLATGSFREVTVAGAPWMVGAGVAEGIYFGALARAYECGTFGVAYTVMRGGAMLLVWAVSATILHESLTPVTAAGVALLFWGIGQVNGWNRGAGSLRDAYLGAVCIAAYHIFYGQALQRGWDPSPLFACAMAIGCVLIFFASRETILAQSPTLLRTHRWIILGSGACCAASFLLFLSGLRFVPPGTAISLRNLSVLFGALFSFLLHERITPRQWAGMVAMACGVLLLGH